VALRWLKKYGLTNEECQNFLWDRAQERLIVSITRNDKVVFWQGRKFGLMGPKYLSWGKVPWDPPLAFGDKGPIVFVEDVVSAIKVGHIATGVPLFGSYVSANALKWASEQLKPIGLWLDPDKRRESLVQALKATATGVRVYTLTSDKDPKEHTDEDIRRTVGNLFPDKLSNY
jgi:DNA primase